MSGIRRSARRYELLPLEPEHRDITWRHSEIQRLFCRTALTMCEHVSQRVSELVEFGLQIRVRVLHVFGNPIEMNFARRLSPVQYCNGPSIVHQRLEPD